MSLNMQSFAAALKVHYTDNRVENMVYKNQPFFAMVKKYEKFLGLNMPIPIITGNPQGRSSTFSNAKAQKTSSTIKAFTLVRARDYALASIDNETIEASAGNADAFMSATTTEIDGAMSAAATSLAISCFLDGSGAIGIVATGGISGQNITLKNPSEVVRFEVGQLLNSYDTTGVTSRNVSVTVTKVDRVHSVVTVSGSLTGVVDTDKLYVAGDKDQKVKGLAAWLPILGPQTGDNFFGVDRTVDPTRLAGIVYDGTGDTIENALINAAALVGREGGKPDACFLSFERFASLEIALGAKIQRVKQDKGEVGFSGLLIHGPRGDIEVYADQNCSYDRLYLLQMDTWKLCSLGKAPKLLESDGNKMLRETDSDGIEVRIGYYAQLACSAPGWNCVVKLA